ncbi:MAG: pentapeptide repeat-containing protein [Flavobacteriaceae bacterium]|nr:pentapeptide repeat-containing protein [Flavobacteriaceae bacterium]
MVKIKTRLNDKGEEEIVISDFSDFEDLVNEIHKIREEERNYHVKSKKIFVKKEVKVEKRTIDYPIDFSNIVFEENVILESIIFNKNINFNNAEFKKKVTFHHCIFHNQISFGDTEFHKLADFYSATFKEPQQFHLTDFLDRVIFSDATFEQEVQFLYCKVNSSSMINFQGTTFNKGIDISRSNFNLGKVSFWDIKVDDEGLFDDALFSEYYKNNFGDNEYPPSVPKKLRESMRFIKNSFYSEGNKIEGSEFEKKELEIYREEIRMKAPSFFDSVMKDIITFLGKIKILNICYKLYRIIETVYKKAFSLGNKCYYRLLFTIGGLNLIFYAFNSNCLIPYYVFSLSLIIFYIGEIVKAKMNNEKYKLGLVHILLVVILYNYLSWVYYFDNEIESNNKMILFVSSACMLFFGTIINIDKDKILLWFNKNSNDFGTDWVKGVIFTTLVGLITSAFVLYPWYQDCVYFNPNTDGLGDFLQNLGEIMNITKWDKFHLLGEKPTSWQYTWLFIGRIFIGYGVYQTIQAFRKYGKS